MRIHNILALLIIFAGFSEVQAQGYSVSGINEEMQKDAHAVVRKEVTNIMVENESRSIMQVNKVITVLDSKGLDIAAIGIPYDKFDKVLEISALLYNKHGKLIKKIKAKEFGDISYSSSSLATDTRLRIYQPTPDSKVGMPFTIEYNYRVQTKGLFSFPRWVPLDDENLAIEFASLELVVPNRDFINHRSQNIKEEVQISQENDGTHYHWVVEDIMPFEREPMSPSFLQQVPMVHLAPKSFNIQGFRGDANDWNNLGAFFYDLNDNRQSLPKELKIKVEELTAGLDDPIEKAKVLYKFMQDNTRYVSIQLGIGGWQTFEAEYVYTNGYGDCKALSNYMKSMLQHLNIPSYTVLVYAGGDKPDIVPDFPANQFNHMILCIPQENDTTWLECTSSFAPFGYLGDFTEDRHVLLLTPEGGKLVKTPGSTAEMNQQFRNTDVFLQKDGSAQVEVSNISTGFQQTPWRYFGEEASERDREKYLRKSIDASSFELESYQFTDWPDSEIPTYQVSYQLDATNWAKSSGPRLFLTPNVLERRQSVPEKNANRTQSIVLQYAYLDRDTVVYHLPNGYEVESLNREPLEIETIFGHYRASVEIKDPNTLIYYRELQMEKMELPPSYYEQLREFFKEINQADRMQVVLSNKS
ncbi:MAG: DUF3857 domain-containing protein [Bacteroidota bacterium]